jgi:hypothetical protein
VSVAAAIGRLARAVGIVAVFGVVGPLLIAAVFSLSIILLATPILEFFFFWIDWQALRPLTLFLLGFLAVIATAPAAFAVGVVFAICSVYFGANALSVVVLIVALAAAGVVVMGAFVAPSESSPLFVPSVRDIAHGAKLWLLLTVPGTIAGALCWLISRPLHRPS